MDNLYIKVSNIKGAGRGVFTSVTREKEEIIEKACVIEMNVKEIEKCMLKDYIFLNPFQSKNCFIVLGYGSLYNHSDEPNVHYYYDKALGMMIFEAIRKIEEHEELYICYGKKWWKSRK